jgi:hypothetical protein
MRHSPEKRQIELAGIFLLPQLHVPPCKTKLLKPKISANNGALLAMTIDRRERGKRG